MNLDKINKWLTLLANVGVLAGILALIYELNQNNQIARAQTRADISFSAQENVRMFQDPVFLEISRKAVEDEDLSIEERTWLNQAYRSEFRSWENVYYQYRAGLFDENEMESYRTFYRQRAADCDTYFAGWYERNRTQIEPYFRAEMDSFFEEAQC